MIQQLAEPLEMHHLALTQEADNLVHVLVVGQAQDIIVRRPGFLLCCHILDNVRNWITLHLEIRRRKRDSAGVRRPNSVGVINIIIRLAVLVEAPRALTVRQLPYYAADYLKVRKLVSAYMVSIDLCSLLLFRRQLHILQSASSFVVGVSVAETSAVGIS